jgi:hypothetical protein
MGLLIKVYLACCCSRSFVSVLATTGFLDGMSIPTPNIAYHYGTYEDNVGEL